MTNAHIVTPLNPEDKAALSRVLRAGLDKLGFSKDLPRDRVELYSALQSLRPVTKKGNK